MMMARPGSWTRGRKSFPLTITASQRFARVFRCKDGGLFVGYLEQYGDAIKSRILAGAEQHPGDAAPDFSLMPMDVKKPGETKWFSMPMSNASAGEYTRITTPICPRGGNEGSSPVSPADSDNGASN